MVRLSETDDGHFQIHAGETAVGKIRIFSKTNIEHIEIEKPYRENGYGSRALREVIPRLKAAAGDGGTVRLSSPVTDSFTDIVRDDGFTQRPNGAWVLTVASDKS